MSFLVIPTSKYSPGGKTWASINCNFFCSEKADIVPGYDFLVNSVWPEIVHGLEEKLPSLFNPGNPDVFHEVIKFNFFPCVIP